MAGIPYVGATQNSSRDLVNYGYVASLFNNNITQAAVDALINVGLLGYVLKSYVDGQDALNATKAFIDAGDATRLKLAQLGAANGAVPLNVSGRVDASRVSAGSTQRYPQSYYAPSGYNSANVTVTTAETQIYTYSLPNPGFTYKLFIAGLQDVLSSVTGEYGILRVRVGSMTGPVIAGGYGLAENYVAGLLAEYDTAGSSIYTIPAWAQTVDVVAVGAGGGGGNGYTAFFIPQVGSGGSAGAWASVTLTKGGNLPSSTNTLTATVGAGGTAGGGTGGNTTVTGAGITTLTAAGGHGNNQSDTQGHSPGPLVFNGLTYTGGAAVIKGVAGNAPGGGGGGGTPAGSGPGQVAGDGGVFCFARPAMAQPSGSAPIISTPINAQTALTGAQTLYVTLQRSGSASTQVATTYSPKLFVVPIPA